MNNYLLATTAEHYESAEALFREYARELGISLCFQDFDDELKNIRIQYGKPDGGIILLQTAKGISGCAGIRRFENETAELKRMYIRSEYRGAGTGRELLNKAIGLAKDLGYKNLRLDTLPSMEAAVALYQKTGFREITPCRFNPVPGVKYFELSLKCILTTTDFKDF